MNSDDVLMTCSSKPHPDISCVAIPLFVSGFLLIAAALKAFDAVRTASFQLAYDLPYWLVIGAAQAELAVALLLLAGWWPRLSWIAVLGLFLVFAVFTLYRALAGYGSCGCFGPLKVSPWTTFALDFGMVLLLVAKRRAFIERQPLARPAMLIGAVGCVLLGGVSLFTMVGSAPKVLHAGESALGEGQLVVLKPAEWVEQEFPLIDHILPRIDSLSNDDWIVLLYHHDCPKCQEALPRYEKLAGDMVERGDAAQVVLVEVPPFGETLEASRATLHARLSADREWFVQAPVEIQLRGGKVTLASLDLPSVSGPR